MQFTKAMTANLLISGTANPAAGVTTGTTVATRNGAEFQFALPLTYSANRTLSNQVVGGITTGGGEVATPRGGCTNSGKTGIVALADSRKSFAGSGAVVAIAAS